MTSLLPRDRATRVALVTTGLSATGAVIGALCAASSVAIIAVAGGGLETLTTGPTMGIIELSAAAGAFVGMIGAPLLGWGLLRRVPLGRVILVTALGAIIGAVVGEWTRPFNPYPRTMPGVIAGALIGFLLSGIGLRLLAQRELMSAADEAV